MSLIKVSHPDGPYSSELDTGVMDVEIREAFLGVGFVTENGERLAVSMRDGGYEVHYTGDFGETGFDAGWFRFNNGVVNDDKPDQDETVEDSSLSERKDAWLTASAMLVPIIEQHGVEIIRQGNVMVSTNTVSKTSQHVDLVLLVGDWLLGKDV